MPMTVHQQQVLSALHQDGGPLTAYALLSRLHGTGISAPAQVYRALDRLAEEGLVHRLETLNAWFACTRTPDTCRRTPRAFAICDQCGRVDEFSEPALGRTLGRWAQSRAFETEQTTIELHGRCGTCVNGACADGAPDVATPPRRRPSN